MAIAYVVTGKFVVSVFAMLLLTFMTDFAKIALATDHIRSSSKPETWNIGGFITVSVILGIAMVTEALLLLRFGWAHFDLATNNNALYTFSFLILLYFAVFSVVSARERRAFWSTMPSKALTIALMADALTGTVLTRVGLPGLMPLPWSQMLVIFVYAIVSCLVVNDAVKVAVIKCVRTDGQRLVYAGWEIMRERGFVSVIVYLRISLPSFMGQRARGHLPAYWRSWRWRPG